MELRGRAGVLQHTGVLGRQWVWEALGERGKEKSRFCPDMSKEFLIALLVITLIQSLHNQRLA